MSQSSLVPERQLVFSPGLAATIGLEEAVLLQHLQALFEHRQGQLREGYAWLEVERDYLLNSLPFWSATELSRIVRSLVDKGVLLVQSPPLHSSPSLVFALNERRQRTTTEPAPQPAEAPRPARSAAAMPGNWCPSEDLLQLLTLNHNIPRAFALEQLEDFIFYWRDRGVAAHSWENKFRNHVIGNWRRQQQREAERFAPPQTAVLDKHWRPSADAMEILLRAEVERDFIEQAIPEFVLYWQDKGADTQGLNSKFVQHIRMQWARYTSSLSHSTEPQRIRDDWFPSADVFDILELSHIDRQFAEQVLPEFILYWRDSNQAHTSWNSKFIAHVKHLWGKRLESPTGQQHGQHPGSHQSGRTRDRSLQDDLNDTSWAN